jgi:hypothetical protein
MRLGAVFALILITLLTSSASATQIEYRSVEELGVDANLVVRGEVSSVRSYWNESRTRILTETTVRVTDEFKGRAGGEVRIVQMGGELDGIRMTVAGALEWQPGEDVVLFLEDSLPGQYRVSGFSQGKYSVQRDPRSGEEFVVQAGLGSAELVGASRSFRAEQLQLDDLLQRALPQIYEGE